MMVHRILGASPGRSGRA